jgi:hypothetical protein
MATAISWSGLETIEGIINGMVVPERLPFASLDADTQADIIDEIDNACTDIAGEVTEACPDLNDPAQRNDRLRRYRAEVMRRKDPNQRPAFGEYFDAIMGVCLRNAGEARSYTIDSCGCASPAA